MNDNRPTHLDLFSGQGGFSVAFESVGFRTSGFVEFHPIKRIVLKEWWPDGNFFDDIRAFSGTEFCRSFGRPHVVTGGVPCQPASALGLMRGTSDERWLWPEATRVVRETRPDYFVFENPPSLISLESGRAWNGIVSGLAALGYDLWWDVFPAAAFGAGHLRERVILVGSDTNGSGLQGHAGNEPDGDGWPGARRPVAPPDLRGRVDCDYWWHEAHSGIPVLADGLPNKLVEAASLCAGDSIVPQVVVPIAKAIYQLLRPETK